MGRLIRIIVVVGLVAAIAVWMANHSGSVTIEWLGWRLDTFVPVFLFALVVVGLVIRFVLRLLVWFLGFGPALGRRWRARKLRHGLSAASEALSALIVEDSTRARQFANTAARDLQDTPLATLLQARVATLDGDIEAMRVAAEKMVSQTPTLLVGLRFQFEDKIALGKEEEAIRLGARILSLHPRARWVLGPQIEMLVRRREWDAALDTLKEGRRNGVLEEADAIRLMTTIFCRRAEEAMKYAQATEAIRWAKKAVAASPGFVPATLLLMRAFKIQGDIRKAAAAAESAWEYAAHPDIATVYMDLFTDDSPVKQVTRAQQLASRAPQTLESRLVVAKAALAADLWGEARAQLEPLTSVSSPDSRAAVLMARVERAERGDFAAAAKWFEKAIEGSSGRTTWSCSACGERFTMWDAFCGACGAFSTLRPLPEGVISVEFRTGQG